MSVCVPPPQQLRSLLMGSKDLVGEQSSKKKNKFKFFVQRPDGRYIFKVSLENQFYALILTAVCVVNVRSFMQLLVAQILLYQLLLFVHHVQCDTAEGRGEWIIQLQRAINVSRLLDSYIPVYPGLQLDTLLVAYKVHTFLSDYNHVSNACSCTY